MTKPALPWLTLVGTLMLTWLAYSPGLSGGFLFDDFVNLNALGATGPVDDWPTFWRYVTSGVADPIGRPISLLSFLLDARDWPAEPASFLRTNLIIHLLNGCLVFALVRKLETIDSNPGVSASFTAIVASGIWMLHPLFVSTTLYVVQREAMLPASFVLLGLIAYIHGRTLLASGRTTHGAAWTVSGLLLGTLFATLCKANGILLPLLALVIEFAYLDARLPVATRSMSNKRRSPLRVFMTIKLLLLILPSIAVAGYLMTRLPYLDMPLSTRPWTIGERLLTEPRVLFDYLRLLFVPRSVSTGLYNESFPASTGLILPIATLPAIFCILLLPALAILFRKIYPRLATAVLFFLSGHLLESTTIPLELYFEHRNYLPAVLLFWPVARALQLPAVTSRWRVPIVLLVFALLASTTYQRASLWGRPHELARLWAAHNDTSPRAQTTLALLDTQAGRPDLAMKRLGPLWRDQPEELQFAFNFANAACATRGLTSADIAAMAFTLRHSGRHIHLMHGWLSKAISTAKSDQCPGLTLPTVESWVAQALTNPAVAKSGIREQDFEPLLAQLALAKDRPDEALAHFNRALLGYTTPDVAARQTSMLASAGYYEHARLHLDFYKKHEASRRKPAAGIQWVHAKVLDRQGYWDQEFAILRSKLEAEISSKPSRAKDSNP